VSPPRLRNRSPHCFTIGVDVDGYYFTYDYDSIDQIIVVRVWRPDEAPPGVVTEHRGEAIIAATPNPRGLPHQPMVLIHPAGDRREILDMLRFDALMRLRREMDGGSPHRRFSRALVPHINRYSQGLPS
jgi:hypothetical protein